jgi:hypothetical protein
MTLEGQANSKARQVPGTSFELYLIPSLPIPHSCLSSITQMVPDKTVVEKVLIVLCNVNRV